MTSPRRYKFGARPKWTAQAVPNQPCLCSGETPILPWRDKSLWRITTTKSIEGLLSEEPSRGAKKRIEEFSDALTKKHAMEYAKMLKEYEEVKEREKKNE